MHIEVTDHLRCPADHEEAYLILLPGRMEGRRVLAGDLACPACGWQTHWEDGVPVFGAVPATLVADPESAAALPEGAIPTMLGIEGPGGWVALVGAMAAAAPALGSLLPGVGLIVVNPPDDIEADATIQVVRSPVWPLKAHALRGAVHGSDVADWSGAILASVLPGRHLIGAGPLPDANRAELLAEADGIWVVRRR